MEYDIKINKYGETIYYKKGTKIIHREDGPAVETDDGDKYWYINGKRHREDGPAIERYNGDWYYMEWFINGETHRSNGPAIESSTGYKAWYINGQHHKEIGPAVVHSNGDKEWWINGKRLSLEKEAILNRWWNNKNGV